MRIQIVNFQLKDITDADYRKACEGIAPVFAEVAGLLSKVWLADQGSNAYGGVYTWLDRTAMAAHARSDLFHAMATNPNLTNLVSRDFDVLEAPSRVTRG